MRLVDFTGQRFGMLTALEHCKASGGRQGYWLCRCDCGGMSRPTASNLRRGGSRSCGCQLRADVTGQRFGRLVALRFSHHANTDKAMWVCMCDCGTETTVRLMQMRNGRTTSCGCRLRELQAAFTPPTIHGLSRTRIFRIWNHMLQRCGNPNNRKYRFYGGRGIAVCERWQTFANFAADMHDAYQAHVAQHGVPDTTVDRIDNDRGYEPGNVRWATRAEQYANRRPQGSGALR